MKKIFFVHGFGVMKDSQGLFIDLSQSLELAGYQCCLIDLNTRDEEGNITQGSLSAQVGILRSVWASNCTEGDECYIIAHSLGCVVTSSANIPNTVRTLFLAPPTRISGGTSKNRFTDRPGTVIDREGESRLARKDGTFTIVPAEVWREGEVLDVPALYAQYCNAHDVFVVRANQDKLVDGEHYDEVFGASRVVSIDGSHDFAGSARPMIAQLCQDLLGGVKSND